MENVNKKLVFSKTGRDSKICKDFPDPGAQRSQGEKPPAALSKALKEEGPEHLARLLQDAGLRGRRQ